MRESKCNNVCSCSATSIWRNYAIGITAVAVVPVAGLLLPAELLPFLSLLISLFLFSHIRKTRTRKTECALVPYMSARVLLGYTFFAAILYVAARYVNENLGVFWQLEMRRHSFFYLAVLYLVVAGAMSRRQWSNTFCTACLLRNGMPQEREVLGHIYASETRYLYRRLLKMSGLVAVLTFAPVAIGFYKTPDSILAKIVSIYVPLALMVADILYMRFRYSLVGTLREKEVEEKFPFEGKFKLIRILVIKDEKVYFVENEGIKDTPFVFTEPFDDEVSHRTAQRYMADMLGESPDNDTLRFCYGTIDPINRRSIEHYLYFAGDKSEIRQYEEKTGKRGLWLSKPELEQNFSHGFSRLVCSEFHRIYTVMQTSKLYFPNGKKKILIKGYKPSFSLSELKHAEVDFSDNRWMLLSRFNKDVSFYTLKKAWHRYIEGLN